MNSADLERLARAVAEELSNRRHPGAARHEVADVAWRMPAKPRSEPPASASNGDASVSRRGAAGRAIRVADLVDHTLLKAEATRRHVDRLCDEALEHRFAAVCVNGIWVAHCASRLRDSGVMVATVVGFPLGAMTHEAKASETRIAVNDGANEIDMVAPVGHIVDSDWDVVESHVRAVVGAASGRTVKVILESAALEPAEIIKASVIAREAGAGFVKTSTGVHPAGGATTEAVAIMSMAVGDTMGIKASGGIRDCTTALRMIAAGATRLGTSSGVKFVECMGGPLSGLIADPGAHGEICRMGGCEI